MSVLLEAVEAVSRIAGDHAHSFYGRAINVEAKGDGSPVTIADREAESLAREWIHANFPDDGVLGEEYGEQVGSSGRKWILDPIDGTKSFVRGVPLWGTLVAVVEGESVLAGSAYYPAVGEMLAAAPGEGCWWNGRPARVSNLTEIASATALITDERAFASPSLRDGWRRLNSDVAVQRSWGDCYGYLLVATGRAEVMVDPIVNPWDAACFQPIIEEAGGVFTDLRGKRTPFGGDCIATNAHLDAIARSYFQ